MTPVEPATKMIANPMWARCMGKEFFMELAMVAAYRAVHGGHKTWETFFMEDDNKPKPPRYFQEIMKEEQITMAEPVV